MQPSDPIVRCPHCGQGLDGDLSRLWGVLMRAKRGRKPPRTTHNRFALMSDEERRAAAKAAADARWTRVRAERHQSIAAPPAKPKKHTVIDALKVVGELLKGDANVE